MVEYVQASEVKRIAKWIADGGSCLVQKDAIERRLAHDRVLDRPLHKLPWPLSLLQPMTFDYSERPLSLAEQAGAFATVEEIAATLASGVSRRFASGQRDEAVRFLLRDLEGTTEVLLLRR